MNDFVKEMLQPIVRGFIDDGVFSLVTKLVNWLDARIASRTAKVLLAFLLSLTAIASIVVITALAGF